MTDLQYTCPTPIQEAVARGFEKEMSRLGQDDCYFKSISVDLQRKRDFLAKVLTEVGMKPVIPEGGYFMMADWSSLADKIDLSSETDSARDYRYNREGPRFRDSDILFQVYQMVEQEQEASGNSSLRLLLPRAQEYRRELHQILFHKAR